MVSLCLLVTKILLTSWIVSVDEPSPSFVTLTFGNIFYFIFMYVPYLNVDTVFYTCWLNLLLCISYYVQIKDRIYNVYKLSLKNYLMKDKKFVVR